MTPAGQGHNNPPLLPADELKPRLDLEGAHLLDRAADLDLEASSLPVEVDTAEQAAAVTDVIAKGKRLLKDADAFRVEQKEPYFAAAKIVDAFAKEISAPIDALVDSKTGMLIARLNAYQRALRIKEEAAAAERARIQREEQAKAEARARAQREAAEAAERAAREAEQAVRNAANAEAREKAAQAMRDQERAAADARKASDEAAKAAAGAERKADAADKAASGAVSEASRVTAGGATAGTTRYWSHSIVDADALQASLGVLGRYLSPDAITQALNAVQREFGPAKDGAKPTIEVPGVRFYIDFRTSVGSSRR